MGVSDGADGSVPGTHTEVPLDAGVVQRPETPSSGDTVRSLEAARRAAVRVADDLAGELAAIAESTQANPDDEHDAEGATVGYERARVTALLASTRATIDRLDRAIVRAGQGGGSACEVCGRDIEQERLDALPGTTRCTTCARVAGGATGMTSRIWRNAPVPPLGSDNSRKRVGRTHDEHD